MRDHRTGTGNVASPDFVAFANNWVTPYSTQNFTATTYLQGNANRYFRANETGLFVQDKFQVTPTLSITAGVRYDWNGGLTEKNGNLFNFDPSQYSYDCGLQTPSPSSGFIIAGNNKNGTSGVSKTTLTGRQWGIAPRFGFAWQPSNFHSKFVVRGGSGFYYDRGELFTYLSPGYAAGEVEGGPFGIMQTPPFVTQQHCPYASSYQQLPSDLSLPELHAHLRRERISRHRRQLELQPGHALGHHARAPVRPIPKPPTSPTISPTPRRLSTAR